LNSSVYRARVALIIVFPFADCQLWDTFGGGKIKGTHRRDGGFGDSPHYRSKLSGIDVP
jgi:hypothetical protein